jgi:gephyrin
MLASSFQITPYAAMARPVAGVRKGTLVIALPGSPKAAKENIQAIIKLLPHACDLACGGNSREMHSERKVAELGKEVMNDSARIHHHHHHDHVPHGKHRGVTPHTTAEQRILLSNQLGGKVTQRYRESPFPMLSVPEATRQILTNTPVGEILSLPVDEKLVGYILAEDIEAKESVPAFRASIVDGYAVLCTSLQNED